MFDIGWTELLVIGVVALIVIGPKDLPGMFHTLGRMIARVKSMGRDFSRAMEDAARETGVNDISKDLRNIANPRKMGLDAVKNAATKFENWDPLAKTDAPAGKSDKGPATKELSKERAATAKKIREATAAKAQARLDAEAESATAEAPAPKPAAKKPAAKKSPAKKTATAKTSTPKTPAKKSPAKKPAAKKPTTTKAAAKSTPAKKPAPKNPASNKAGDA